MFSPGFISRAIALLGLGLAVAEAESPRAHLTAEDRRLFAWFDTLGVEDISHAQLVRVRVENASSKNLIEKPAADEPRAFLLAEKEGRFHFLLGDLTSAVLERRGSDPQELNYVGWRVVPLDEETSTLLEALDRVESGWDPTYLDGHLASQDLMELRSQAFVLARYCLAHDREDLAARLLRVSERLIRKSRDTPSFEEGLQADIGAALIYRFTLKLADPHQDRRALAALIEAVIEHCPNKSFPQQATLARGLRKLAAEDDTHQEISEAAFAKLPPAEQARELVFQLRNEFCSYPSYSWARPWPFEPRETGTRQKLTALGLPAVPALLEALADDRPSRTVRCWGGSLMGITSESIQDLAVQALAGISRINFRTNGIGDGEWIETRHLAEEWWTSVRENKEIDWFQGQITAGKENALDCVEAVSQRFPAELPAFLRRTIPLTADAFCRERMIRLLAPTDTEDVNVFLLEQLATDPARIDRVAASYVLRQHHHPEATAAMLAEFEALKPVLRQTKLRPPATDEELQDHWSGADAPFHVLRFLLTGDSPLAVQEVRSILPNSPELIHNQIITACADALENNLRRPVEHASPATRAALRELLLAELPIETVPGDKSAGLHSYRAAELAAAALAQNWPEQYQFDLNQPQSTRTTQLAALRTKVAAEGKGKTSNAQPPTSNTQ